MPDLASRTALIKSSTDTFSAFNHLPTSADNFGAQPIHLSLQLEAKMSIDDIKNGERINCNGVYGTIIGKRSTRNRRLVLVRMDNGFTLKLNPHTLSVKLPEAGAIAQLNEPTKQLASVD
jgi:hypothetical protein